MSSCIGWDTETHLIGPQRIAPPLVCLSVAEPEPETDAYRTTLVSTYEDDQLDETVDYLLCEEEDLSTPRVAHNASYDLGVIAARYPHLLPIIFDRLERGEFQCTIVREKLLNLQAFGSVKYWDDAEGKSRLLGYSLADLVAFYLGDTSLKKLKKDEDAWRTNYAELEDLPIAEWPEEAVTYATDDSFYVCEIWTEQEKRRQQLIEDTGVDPFATLAFRCMADFCLHLMTCWGFKVDAEVFDKIDEILAYEVAYDKQKLLIESGILTPAQPPQPYKNGARDSKTGELKYTKAKPEKINQKLLRELVVEVCQNNNLEVLYTASSVKYPDGQISLASERLKEISHLDPILGEYMRRQNVNKLITTELPRLTWDNKVADVVHPVYDVLKNTGRTSSYASKLFPSFNTQNIASDFETTTGQHIRVRNCICARPGMVLLSSDYSQMELGTLGQKCLDLFGYSVLADKINAGYDTHAYLGAQLARALHSEYRDISPSDPDENYHFFTSLAHDEDPDIKGLYKHFRTFAKPTGLGYPGGLGPETFVVYAKGTYNIVVSQELATDLREVWFQTYPEMDDYFKYINKELIDPRFSDYGDNRYCYLTPLGMLRPNCDFCAAANGVGLQSPSAEGAIGGLCKVVRYAYDDTLQSPISPDEHGRAVNPIGFVHDEIVAEIRDDRPGLREARVKFIERQMIEAMRKITPDVEPRVESALMHRWDKRAEPVFDENGVLDVWTPDEE